MKTKKQIVRNWLPRYTDTPIEKFGKHILLTNFYHYVELFSEKFNNAPIYGQNQPMQTCSNKGLTIINFGMGSANATTIMDLLTAIAPKAVLFLGKCGGTKKSSEIGHYILPTAAIRGEGTSNDYFPRDVPALPSFKLHKFVSDKLREKKLEYRTGVIYTTNRRVWEHDANFREKLRRRRVLGVDMETASIFMTGFYNDIDRGALLLVSDLPMEPEGVKTSKSDRSVTQKYVKQHLDIGIRSMMEIDTKGETIKHFSF